MAELTDSHPASNVEQLVNSQPALLDRTSEGSSGSCVLDSHFVPVSALQTRSKTKVKKKQRETPRRIITRLWPM